MFCMSSEPVHYMFGRVVVSHMCMYFCNQNIYNMYDNLIIIIIITSPHHITSEEGIQSEIKHFSRK